MVAAFSGPHPKSDGCGQRPPSRMRAVAQLGEHLVCNQGVAGSIPASSTNRVTFWAFDSSDRASVTKRGRWRQSHHQGDKPGFIDNRRSSSKRNRAQEECASKSAHSEPLDDAGARREAPDGVQ